MPSAAPGAACGQLRSEEEVDCKYFQNIFSIGNNLEVQVDVCSFEAESAPRGAIQPHRAAGQVLLQQVVDLDEKILVEIVENI